MSAFRNTAKSSTLKDNSWIRQPNNEDELVDDDPNFGKAILSQRKSNDILESTLPSTKTSYTKSTYSSVKSDSPTVTTTTKTTVTDYPKTSTKTTAVTKDGTSTETTITTTETVRSAVSKTPISSETFSERVKSSAKGMGDKPYDTFTTLSIENALSPTNGTRTETLKSSSDTNDKDQYIPSSITDNSKSTVSTIETVTVRSSSTDDVFTSTSTKKTSSAAEDKLYDTLLPSSVRSDSYSPISNTSNTSITKREIITVESSRGGESPTMTRNLSSYSSYSKDTPSTRTTSYSINSSDNYSSDRNTYTYSRPDSSYTSISSPSVYTSTSYKSRSRSDELLSDPIYSQSSVKSVYAAPERTVLEKDLCTVCHKPFTGNAKMVLDDIKIKCHASCFKCEVCNITLGNLKAGDSLWIYKRMVHCENCFDVTKEKWRR